MKFKIGDKVVIRKPGCGLDGFGATVVGIGNMLVTICTDDNFTTFAFPEHLELADQKGDKK